MRRLALPFALAAGLLAAAAATGEERQLSGPEIAAALAGNTVHSFWGATEYRSYFDPDGGTTYLPKGGEPDTGQWRVTDTQYCSTWRSAESCYTVLRDGDRIIWLAPGSGKRYPSRLIAGRALGF